VYGPGPWDGKSLTIPYQYFNFNQGYLGGSNSGLPVNKEYVD
jgi:hypothetical protein